MKNTDYAMEIAQAVAWVKDQCEDAILEEQHRLFKKWASKGVPLNVLWDTWDLYAGVENDD